ncbi:MAG: DUF554 family protein, partial [Clostridia bacterium]|nr:DUF554 family protein [Clostridia bacterium]
MYGLGTVINAAAIVVGGLLGLLFGRFIKDALKDTLQKSCGICVLLLGIAGALEGILTVKDGAIVSGNSLLVVCTL